MNKATGFMIFVMGFCIGSLITWQYTKKKYEQIAEDEIESVKAVFSNRESDMEIKVGETEDIHTARVEKAVEKPDLTEYTERLRKNGYVSYSGIKEEDGKPMNNEPYVISPEEFDTLDGYETISLSYYADHVLADENDEIVEDVDGTVGMESLTHFGEYEDDSVFVRNDRLKCDYEILMDQRTYSDVLKTKAHRTEVS